MSLAEDIGFDDIMPDFHLPNERYDLRCPDCGDFLRLIRVGAPGQERLFYGCRQYPTTGCRGSHSALRDGSPRGVPANAETRRWRVLAHQTFDRLWDGEDPRMSRVEAYEWMQRKMQVGTGVGIGHFDQAQCEQLIRLVKEQCPEAQTHWDRLLGADPSIQPVKQQCPETKTQWDRLLRDDESF